MATTNKILEAMQARCDEYNSGSFYSNGADNLRFAESSSVDLPRALAAIRHVVKVHSDHELNAIIGPPNSKLLLRKINKILSGETP